MAPPVNSSTISAIPSAASNESAKQISPWFLMITALVSGVRTSNTLSPKSAVPVNPYRVTGTLVPATRQVSVRIGGR